MRRTARWTGLVDELEGRALLSGTTGPGGIWSNPAVQADLAKIQTDQQTLMNDIKTLAPTLQKDQQGIQTAIQSAIANDASVKSAQSTLTGDEATAKTTLQNDWKAITSATTPSARIAAFKVYLSDAASAAKTLAADEKAVWTAINADSGVQAAQSKLQTDEAPITADQAALKADYTQLAKDIKAAFAG
jgi:hypothetical protein